MNVRLIVPNCNRNTSPIVAYGKTIADIAGGFTATQATGAWRDNQGVLVVEPVTVFDCSCNDRTVADYPTLAETDFQFLASRIARELRPDCVCLAINGIVQFVKP